MVECAARSDLNRDRSRLERTTVGGIGEPEGRGSGAPNTPRAFGPLRPNVLALWLRDEELEGIESVGPERVALAGWATGTFDVWRLSRSAIELTGCQLPDRPELDPVVREAVVMVASMSNPANGFSSYNRDYAIEAFRILVKAGYRWDPTEAAALAASEGLDLDHAVELKKLAVDLQAGKTKRGSGHHKLASDVLRVWQQKASGKAEG